jgi:CRISPR-associated protein Cmr5
MSKKDKHKKHQSSQMRPLQGGSLPDANKNKATMDVARVEQRQAQAAPPGASGAAMQPLSRQSLAQLRAVSAHKQIRSLVETGVDTYGGYASYVRSLPAKIIMSGLGQALAMEKAQGKKPKGAGHKFLYQHMNDWLTTGWPSGPYRGQTDIVSAIIKGEERDYLRTQMEAMEYLIWLKKFSDAELETPEGAGDD